MLGVSVDMKVEQVVGDAPNAALGYAALLGRRVYKEREMIIEKI
jgi:hypothetical protein